MLDRTDSYCERCGTRYAFRANAPRALSLKGAKVLAKGLRNFVLTDGLSMNDSIALARHDDEREDTTRMTEAFHRTFNFCMTCRQYACDKCWNAHQGACLTCAPERESGPVAPEEHLIIRTPVARSDSDWALFPVILDGKGEPAADLPLASSAWPAQDFQAMASGASSGGNAKKAHDQPVRTQEDQEAWSVWPIADEIAPEMTLTPGEMVLVEAQLAQAEPIEDATVVVETVSSQPLPAVPGVEVWALPGDLAGISVDAGEPSSPTVVDDLRLASGPVVTPPEQQAVPVAAADIAPPPPTAPLPPPTAPPGQRPVVARLLGRFSALSDADSPLRGPEHASQHGIPSGEPWPRATAWSERPISVPEWSADANPASTGPVVEAVAEVGAEVVAELGAEPETTPIGAAYSETPVEPQPVEVETGVEAKTAELSVEPTSSPESFADEPRAADVANFAELLGPVASAPPAAPIPVQEPVQIAANQQTLFDAAPATDDLTAEPGPEPVAWPEVFGDLAAGPRKPAPPDAIPTAPPLAVSTPPSRRPQVPASWPPLGASWPAQQTAGAPWPGPDAPSVPAVMAAREAAIPVLAEMWAQSAQQVLNRGPVRVCHHCALPVSTQARFCRRCGTKQA